MCESHNTGHCWQYGVADQDQGVKRDAGGPCVERDDSLSIQKTRHNKIPVQSLGRIYKLEEARYGVGKNVHKFNNLVHFSPSGTKISMKRFLQSTTSRKTPRHLRNWTWGIDCKGIVGLGIFYLLKIPSPLTLKKSLKEEILANRQWIKVGLKHSVNLTNTGSIWKESYVMGIGNCGYKWVQKQRTQQYWVTAEAKQNPVGHPEVGKTVLMSQNHHRRKNTYLKGRGEPANLYWRGHKLIGHTRRWLFSIGLWPRIYSWFWIFTSWLLGDAATFSDR